jgi:hypothetical protein
MIELLAVMIAQADADFDQLWKRRIETETVAPPAPAKPVAITPILTDPARYDSVCGKKGRTYYMEKPHRQMWRCNR